MTTTAAHLSATVNQDGATILDILRNQTVTLNSTGGYIWERLERGMSIDEIIQDLAQETGTDREVIRADTHVFLKQLAQKHLLSR